jgi:Peptidase C13 family
MTGTLGSTAMTPRSTFRLIAFAGAALLCAAHPALAQRMHYLGIAGSSRETVFRSEVSGAGQTVGAAWALASSRAVGGSVKGGETYRAIRQSIRQAAEGMDRELDVLFLVVSSHGERGGRGVELSGGGMMSPRMLRAALDEAGVRNRIVLVSACFSGQFVGPMSGPNTAVITAANATNFSFGCITRCSYTDFGEAFFNHGMLKSGRDLRQAFGVARAMVTASERRDGLKPSQPQMSMGDRIGAVLAGLR